MKSLEERVLAGEITLQRAECLIRETERETRRVAEAAAESPSCTVDVRLGDFRSCLSDIPDGSVDAVITDPPYPQEYLPLLADLATFADRVLKPYGQLVVLFGHCWLPEVFRLLDGHRPYRWTMSYCMPGPSGRIWPRKAFAQYKPVLVYGAVDMKTTPFIHDTITPQGSNAVAKEHHRWGQDLSAFETLVRMFTKPGELVCDPFMGAGTTLLAAHFAGRHAIGCDLEEASVAETQRRLAATPRLVLAT